MNEKKFDGKAEVYSKFRPSYPDEFINYLYDNFFESEDIIADIGSGTGKLTEQLLQKGSTVYAVEPNSDMRKTAEENLKEYDKFFSINASAESTALLDKSIDHITVAQAFHWFDKDAFKEECKRILKPGGKVILVWNSRDEEHIITKENEEINIKYCPNFNGFSGGISGPMNTENIDYFFDGKFEMLIFSNPLIYDKEGFIGRNLSSSYAPKGTDENHHKYIDELSAMFDKFSVDGLIAYPFITRCFVASVN